MDLVEAFLNIGLPEGATAPAGLDSAGDAPRKGDYSVPTRDHLRRYYLVSRGREVARADDD